MRVNRAVHPGKIIIGFFFCLFASTSLEAQVDSTIEILQQIPFKYISAIDSKVDRYSQQITSKTKKTLEKLSRWETKIKDILLKINPEAANRLFENSQVTFTSLLEQVQRGEDLALQYQASYNKYTDEVTTNLKFLAQQKEQLDNSLIKEIKSTNNKMKELAAEENKSEALQQFIKERKKQLVEQAFQYIGKSKYLIKINKEAYYYAETLKNYKELFSDAEKAEETVKTILNKIPLFQQFVRKNSLLASLFSQSGDVGSAASMAGLQTRASVQSILQDRVLSGGESALQKASENIREAREQQTKLKEGLVNPSIGNGGGSLPDFKPNGERTKTFKQRLEFGGNVQSQKGNAFLPVTTDFALSAGYKMNDKNIIGIAASYKLGWGSNWKHITLSSEGVGLRSFLDIKVKGSLWISGGYEQNYQTSLTNIGLVRDINTWQASGLIGATKKITVGKKTKSLQLLWDFLSYQQVPRRQPVLFRIGYVFQ